MCASDAKFLHQRLDVGGSLRNYSSERRRRSCALQGIKEAPYPKVMWGVVFTACVVSLFKGRRPCAGRNKALKQIVFQQQRQDKSKRDGQGFDTVSAHKTKVAI